MVSRLADFTHKMIKISAEWHSFLFLFFLYSPDILIPTRVEWAPSVFGSRVSIAICASLSELIH